MEDVDRYLESGEIGRKEFKSKDRLSMISSQSTSVTMKSTLSVSMGQSSDLDMIANDQQIPRSASSKEHMSVPVSECISNQCCTNKDAKEKQLQENSETKHGTEKAQARDRQCKNKHKKEINLPRRASKRLAGIKVDPVPELKTRNRARRAAAKQSGTDGLAKQFNAPAGGLEVKYKSEKHTDMTLEVQRSDKHKEFFSFSHLQNNASVEECVRVLQNGDKSDAKLDYTLDFPLRELLTDPCIAFAIQTLTGVTFEPYKNSQTSAAAGADGEEHGKKSNDANPGNLANPQEHADDDAKTENAGPSSSEKTLDMSLMDPCIDFAIKTLTGTIPLVDSDQNPKKQHSEIALSSVSTLDNIHQTDYCCSQYFGTQTNV